MAQQDAEADDATLVELLPTDEQVPDEDREEAVTEARALWQARETTDVEVDGESIIVSKPDFSATFDASGGPNGPEVSSMGVATFESHDERGYVLLEGFDVIAEGATYDAMCDALQQRADANQERRARRREFRNMVL